MSFYYPQVYQQFLETRYTLPSLPGDHPDWHKGRKHYYCWAISVDSDDIYGRWLQAQRHYAAYLREDYHRQLHLTVAVCGFWQPQDLTVAHNDDFTPAMLQRQLERLAQAAIAPFHLDVGGVNSFASAPFLEVGDDHNVLARLRELLLLNGDDFRSSAYCPHITLGLYRDRFESALVGVDFTEAIDTMPLKLAVSSLDLLSYEASATGAPLKLEQRVWLT